MMAGAVVVTSVGQAADIIDEVQETQQLAASDVFSSYLCRMRPCAVCQHVVELER